MSHAQKIPVAPQPKYMQMMSRRRAGTTVFHILHLAPPFGQTMIYRENVLRCKLNQFLEHACDKRAHSKPKRGQVHALNTDVNDKQYHDKDIPDEYSIPLASAMAIVKKNMWTHMLLFDNVYHT